MGSSGDRARALAAEEGDHAGHLVEGQIADQAASHGIAESDVLHDVLLARTAVKRLVEPDEVAGMVAFLCGPGTSSITGTSHVMDGGWTAA